MDFFGRSDYAHYIDFSLSSFESQHCLWVISLTYCLLGKKLWEPRFLEFFRRIAHQRRRTFLKKQTLFAVERGENPKIRVTKRLIKHPTAVSSYALKETFQTIMWNSLQLSNTSSQKKYFFNESKNKIFILPYHSTYKQKDESKKVRKILCRPHYLADFK